MRKPIFGDSTQDIAASFAVLPDNSGMESIIALLQFSISFMARLAAVLCVFMIVYAAFKMLISLGDQDKWKQSLTIIKNALLGLFIAITAEMVVQLTILLGSNILS